MSIAPRKVVVQKVDPEKEAKKVERMKEFYDVEDTVAKRMGHEELKKQFMELSGQLRRLLEPIAVGESTEPLPSSVLVQVATMKRLSRLTQYATAQLKKENNVQLEQVEAKYLELQNANSEIEHLQKEVKRCLQFNAGDDDLDMVPEEEFYAQAPETISKVEETKDNEHLRHLARLTWELEQRKQLMSALNDQENRRGVLLSDIEGKEQRLRTLKPKIAALIKAARPVQDLLGVQPSASTSSEQRALLGVLPHDLCVLYVQAEAYKDIIQDTGVHVCIVGDVEEAQKWSAKKDEPMEVDSDDEGTVGDDPPEDAMETDCLSPAPRRKRTVSSRLRCVKENLIDPHPVYVTLDVDCEDDVQVGLRFHHFPAIRTTVLRYRILRGTLPSEELICDEENLFDELYPKDYGNSCPDQVGNAKLQHCKLTVDSFAEYGRPYHFVQAMTGSGDSEEGGVQLADRLQKCIKMVRERVAVRAELAEHIKLLESLRLSSFQNDSYPAKITTELIGFEHISEEEYLAALSSVNETNGLGFFFKVSFRHQPTDSKLKSVVFIPAGYPREACLFSLRVFKGDTEFTSQNDDFVKLLETFVNEHSGEHRAKEAKSLLAHQVLSLACRFDVLCDLHPEINGGLPRNLENYEAAEGCLPLRFSPETGKFHV